MSLRDMFMRDSKQDMAQPSTTFEADEFYSSKKLPDLSAYPDDLTRAKRIFFFVGCNHFLLSRSDWEQEYRKYGIDERKEKKWRDEFVAFWLTRLSVDDLTAVHRLEDCEATEALPTIMQLAPTGDSYAQFWFANTIYQLMRLSEIYMERRPVKDRSDLRETCKRARELAMGLWSSLVEAGPGNMTMTAEHEAAITPYLAALQASTPGEYLVNYASRRLASANNPHKVSIWA